MLSFGVRWSSDPLLLWCSFGPTPVFLLCPQEALCFNPIPNETSSLIGLNVWLAAV